MNLPKLSVQEQMAQYDRDHASSPPPPALVSAPSPPSALSAPSAPSPPSTSPVLSKRARLDALVQQRRLKNPVPNLYDDDEPDTRRERVKPVPTRLPTREPDSSEEERILAPKPPRDNSKSKRAPGQSSKKEIEAMNQKTAEYQRQLTATIEPRSKQQRPMSEIFKGFSKPLPIMSSSRSYLSSTPLPSMPKVVTPSFPFQPSLSLPQEITISSSDPIMDTSSVERSGVGRRGLDELKAPRTTQAFVPVEETQVEEDEDEETELLSLDGMRARAATLKEEARKADMWREQKRQMMLLQKKTTNTTSSDTSTSTVTSTPRSRSTKLSLESDDSDLEILERPGTKLAVPSVTTAIKLPRTSDTQRTLERLVGKGPLHRPEETSDSQFAREGHTFGAHLGGESKVIVMDPFASAAAAGPRLKPAKPRKIKGLNHVPAAMDQDSFNQTLMNRVSKQNALDRERKNTLYRKNKNEKLEREMEEREMLGLDVEEEGVSTAETGIKGIIARKARVLAEGKRVGEEGDDEDPDDPDFGGGDGNESEEIEGHGSGSGSGEDGGEEGSGQGSGDEMEEEQTSDVEMEVEESNIRAPKSRRGGPIVDDEEDEEPLSTAPAQLPSIELDAGDTTIGADEPGRMKMPSFMLDGANDDLGFSQFFEDGFSQAVLGDANALEGFHSRPSQSGPPAATWIGPVLINDVERAEDAKRLEGMGRFRAPGSGEENARLVAGTPAGGRTKYINSAGFMTQTRPANPFQISPLDDDEEDTESQNLFANHASTPTQLSPTQYLGVEPTSRLREPSPTLLVTPTQPDEDEEASAAQRPPRPLPSAFDRLVSTQAPLPPPPAAAKRNGQRSAYIDGEADLSDDEINGMGGGNGSGDEDEDAEDLDAELTELVDDDVVDADTKFEQDELARERAAEDEARDDAARMARAQGLADGKERNGKRGGLGDFEDDEFDDDGYGTSNRVKRTRMNNSTMADLEANPETQAFARGHNETIDPGFKENENDYLIGPVESSDAEEEEGDERGGRGRISVQESMRQMAENARARKSKDFVELPLSPLGGQSSHRAASYIVTRRKATTLHTHAGTTTEEQVDSQYNVYDSCKGMSIESRSKYFSTSTEGNKEDSQNTTGTTSGRSSAVTGYARANDNAKSTLGGVLEPDSKGRLQTRPKEFGRFKKNGFTT